MRMLRLFSVIFSFSMRRALTFRTDLFFQLLITAFGIIAGFFALEIVYTQTKTLAGWSIGEATALLGTFQIMSGILSTFIEPNMNWFANQVKDGKFDSILLQPVPSIILASLGVFAPLSLLQVLIGIAVVIFGLCEIGNMPTLWNVLGWLILLAVGITITWASRVLIASLAFWVPSVSLDVLYGALWQCGRYPVNIYRQPFRFVATYILPVAFIATIPTEMLIRGSNVLLIVSGLLVGVGAIVTTHLMWNIGLRRYTSATS